MDRSSAPVYVNFPSDHSYIAKINIYKQIISTGLND